MSEFYSIENFISISEAETILEFSLNKLELVKAEIGNKDERKLNEKIRKSSVSFYNYFEKYEFIKERLETNISNFFNIKGFYVNFENDLQFTEYKTGEFYNWHTDSSKLGYNQRFCSVVILLNDKYEGGNLEILDSEKNKYIFPKKTGSIFIFPSHLEHRVTMVESNIRYSLVGWFSLKKKENTQKTLI